MNIIHSKQKLWNTHHGPKKDFLNDNSCFRQHLKHVLCLPKNILVIESESSGHVQQPYRITVGLKQILISWKKTSFAVWNGWGFNPTQTCPFCNSEQPLPIDTGEADQAAGMTGRMRRAERGPPTTSCYKSLRHQAPQLKIVAIDMYSVNCGPWCLTVLLVSCNTSGGWSN